MEEVYKELISLQLTQVIRKKHISWSMFLRLGANSLLSVLMKGWIFLKLIWKVAQISVVFSAPAS